MAVESGVYTIKEVAELLRVSRWTVGEMCRDGRLPRVPGLRNRIPAGAVHALMEGRYSGADGQPDGQAPAKAAASRRGNRAQANGSLAGEAVGGGGALHRTIGPAEGDVVVRCVSRRSRRAPKA